MTSCTDDVRLYAVLFLVAALLASTGCALGDGHAGTTSLAVCADALEATSLHEDMNRHFYRKSVDCLDQNGGDFENFGRPKTLDERKAQLGNLCGKRGPIRECLDAVERTSMTCQNQTSHQLYRMVRELIKTTYDAGCIQDGEVIATMVTTYLKSTDAPFTSDPLRDCITTAVLGFPSVMNKRVNIKFSSLFYVLYKDIMIVKACLGDITNGDNTTTTGGQIETMLGDIVNKMKCADPLDGSAVLCKTIDGTLPGTPRLCPIKTADENKTSVLDVTTEQLKRCMNPSSIEFDSRLAAIESLEMSRAYVDQQCSKRPTLGRCWADVLSLSSACLNETEDNTVRILVGMLQSAYRYGCTEQGRPFAHVLYKVLKDAESTWDSPDYKNAHLECGDVAGNGDHRAAKNLSTKILWVYSRLNIFRECLVGKLRGDNTAVYYAHTLLTLFRRNMQCLAPEDGSVVPCENVVTTTPTLSGECPYVGEHETFLDQATTCLRLVGVDLDVVEALTTVEESRLYFRTACQRRTDLAHCLDAVTALSASCQNHTGHQTMLMVADLLRDETRIGCEGEGESRWGLRG